MALQSWVEGANGPHGFGLSHLPYGAFRRDEHTRLCVRIGEFALDLDSCVRHGLLENVPTSVRHACAQPDLHALLAAGPEAWRSLRGALIEILSDADGYAAQSHATLLFPLSEVELVLPIVPRGYTDFYASLHHARRVGELFRPDQPLLPNYKHVPIAYNGRASSVVASGTAIARPWGQRRPAESGAAPEFAPTAALDYELELAFVIGPGNELGEPIPIERAHEHLFGIALLNDWSARDIQAWEYQPLGPFLGKIFATSLSPWITPLVALEPFRVSPAPGATGDPQPLPYLHAQDDQQRGALDIALRVSLTTQRGRAEGLSPFALSQSNPRELFWTPAQMVAHHTSNGCNLQPGDLLATGTVSGPERTEAGCLLELTRNGCEPLTLANGEQREWLQDGDEVILSALCGPEGEACISLGECRGRVRPSR